MLGAVRQVQKQLAHRVEAGIFGVQKNLVQFAAQTAAAGFACANDFLSLLKKQQGQFLDLCGLAATFHTLKCNKHAESVVKRERVPPDAL